MNNILKILLKIIHNYKWYFGIVIVIAIAVSFQHYVYTPPPGSVDAKYNYTHYNNFLIFRQSFFHLIQHKGLYVSYPNEYYDLYKYTPTFALLMAPFAYLPDIAGLVLWNILNAVVLFYAFRTFPFTDEKKQLFAIGFILLEAITSLMISESNCLMAGLFVLAYIAIEKKNIVLATFLILLTVFIKPFGLVALSLFLFYPGKWKAFVFSFLWSGLLFVLPLIAISSHELINAYASWIAMLKNDHAISYGISVMSWLYSWFGIEAKNYALLVGVVLFILPLLRYKLFQYTSYRQLFLASILIWVVIFNHKAESPAFIIAISGVAIWFSQSTSKINRALIVIAFLFTILSPMDIYPEFIRDQFFMPYSIKAVPCIIIWIKILYELLTRNFSLQPRNLD